MLSSLFAGFGASLGLIVAIGSQNAFVLRQGLRREHVLPVVALCAVSDALLITAGVAGLGTVVADRPAVLEVIRWSGAAFLLAYATLAVRRMLRPGLLEAATGAGAGLRATLLTCLAFTYLNPHVYLDTVLLLGGLASQEQHRWWFAAGAALASAVWFAGLGGAARRLAPRLARPATWRVLDGLVAATMTVVGLRLVLA
ncbi:MAG: amino acid transporter [Hamadaea sp.]|nr:amino acid transporter [Hamadaea sp.]NUR50379.1 amino acid transporter [Hamadaea sp.]NUT04578.1 amino acid transporter [Hamadaea sp.]